MRLDDGETEAWLVPLTKWLEKTAAQWEDAANVTD